MGDVVTKVDEVEHGTLPRVAVVYDAMSINPMVLAEAARGDCRLVWVVDGGDAAAPCWFKARPRRAP